MMEVRFMLHDARVTRPEKSGEYLTCRVYECIQSQWMTVTYSKKHDLFNAHDTDSAQQAAQHPVNVDYWCENPLNGLFKEAGEDAPELDAATNGEPETFAGDMAKVLTEVADGDAVAHMKRYSIDAPEEPDYDAYPVGE